MKKSRSDIVYLSVVYVILVIAGFITFYPFLYIFFVSLSDPVEFFKRGVTFFPVGFSLDSYKAVLSGTKVWQALYNTVIITAAGTSLGLIMVMFGAYAISKKRLVGRKFFINFMIFTMYFSGGLIPTYILILQLKIYNTLWSLILPGIVSTYYIILARSYFDTLPVELEESAWIDGANDIRILFSIMLPLSKPILAVIGLYFGVGFWNTYLSAVMYIPDGRLHPIQVYLAKVILQNDPVKEIGNLGPDALRYQSISHQLKYTLIIIGIFPIMMVYPFIQKHLVKGMLLGSLKG